WADRSRTLPSLSSKPGFSRPTSPYLKSFICFLPLCWRCFGTGAGGFQPLRKPAPWYRALQISAPRNCRTFPRAARMQPSAAFGELDVTTPLPFSPMSLRDVELKNRIVVAPMHQYSAIKGFPTDWHLMNAGKFAAGGAGLVIMESTKVDRRGASRNDDRD